MHSLDGGAERKITLTDKAGENAKILRLFLQLATTSTFVEETTHNWEGINALQKLVDLTHKWGAPCVRAALWAVLSKDIWDRRAGSVWTFRLFANSQQAGLCTQLLGARYDNYWDSSGTRVFDGKALASVWDPYCWSWDFVTAQPQTYLWALARAYGEAVKKEGGLEKNLSVCFEKYLRAAR